MILTFKTFKEKLESGEKHQTIRKYSDTQFKRLVNCWSKRETTGKYNLFWRNPRNGGKRIKDVVPSDRPALIYFERVNGVTLVWPCNMSEYEIVFPKGENDNSLAQRDGFKDFVEMTNWFYKEHGEILYTGLFMVIRWLP